MEGILIAITIISFVDIGFALHSDGVVRMSSVTTLLLSIIGIFV